MPVEQDAQLPAAVVMPSMESYVLGDGSDSDEYVLALFHISHFKWDCIIGGPNASSEEHITLLIDNGSHSVLIRPETANHLSLVYYKLPVPKKVELAMAEGIKENFVVNEWVSVAVVITDVF